MSRATKWAVYTITGLAGIFLALIVFANINGEAFVDSSSPQAIKNTVNNAVSKSMLQLVDSQLQAANPCLKTVTADPAKTGIAYKYYDAPIDKTLFPAGVVRVVTFGANDYHSTLHYVNDGSCSHRPNSDALTAVGQRSAFAGPLILDPTNSKIIANTFSKTDQKIQTAALAAIDVNKPVGTGVYTQIISESNPTFDITQCCQLVPAGQRNLNPAGSYNGGL